MSVKATDLVAGVEKAYEEKWGYIYGESHTKWTQAKQDVLERKYNSDPEKYSYYELGAKFGSRWIGHTVTDCSGLPYYVLKGLGVRIFHGSNSIWDDDLSHKGKITKGMKLPVGAAIFTGNENSHDHMGTLVTETCVCEAKSTQSGVVHTPLSNKKWTYWGLYKGVQYDFIPGEETATKPTKPVKEPIPDQATLPIQAEITLDTLRKGDKGLKGDEVAYLQKLLMVHGEALPKYGADGDFGNETLKAVKSFQKKHGLVVDGIVGPKTWKALIEEE